MTLSYKITSSFYIRLGEPGYMFLYFTNKMSKEDEQRNS